MTVLRRPWYRLRRILRVADPETVALLTGAMLALGGAWVMLPWGTAAAIPDRVLEVPIGAVFLIVGSLRCWSLLTCKVHFSRWAGLAVTLAWCWLALSIALITNGHNVSFVWYAMLGLASGWSWDRLLDGWMHGLPSPWEGPE